MSVCDVVVIVTNSCQRDDTSDDSKSTRRTDFPPKPIPRRAKAPAGLDKSILLQRHSTMLPQHRGDMSAATDQETTSTTSVKQPVPTFRKKVPADRPQKVPAVLPKCSGETDKQSASSSELSVASSKMQHRRTHSTGNTETLQSADTFEPAQKVSKDVPAEQPAVKTATAQQMEKSESAKKNSAEKPGEKPATKTAVAQCSEKSELAVKLSMRADVSAEKQQTKVEKPEEKSSVKKGTVQQTTDADDVDVKASFRASSKSKLLAKTGLVSEKIESSVKSTSSQVVKLTLNEPGSTSVEPHASNVVPSQELASGESVEEKSNKFQAVGVAKVKLKSTSPTLNVAAPLSSRPARSDSALNVVGLETTNGVEKESKEGEVKNEQMFGSVEQLDSKPIKSSGSLVTTKSQSGSTSSAENRTELKVTLRNTKSNIYSTGTSKDTDKVGSETTGYKSAITGLRTKSDRVTAVESKQSESVKPPQERGSKSEQTAVKLKRTLPASSDAVSPLRQAGLLTAKTTWEQKSASSTATTAGEVVGSQTSEDCQTCVRAVGSEAANSFVPVSKRASVFGSSVMQSSTTDNSKTESNVKTTSSSSGRLHVSKATGSALKTLTAVNSERNVPTDSDSSRSSDVSSGAPAVLTKTVASRVASSASCSSDQHRIKAAVTKTESCDTRGRTLALTTQSIQPSQQGTCEAKNEVVIKAAAISRWPPAKSDAETSVPLSVKPSGTSTGKDQPKHSSVRITSNTVEPENEYGRSSVVSQKLSSVPSWGKPSATLSAKNQAKDSSVVTSVTAEPEKAAVVSQKQSSVPSWVKTSGTSSPLNLRKDSFKETSYSVEPGKVTSSCRSTQAAKPSASSHSGSAASTKMTTSVVATETTSSVPKVMSTSAETPASSVIDFVAVKSSGDIGKPKRNFDSVAATEPVKSTEPPWMAIARRKTQVWTDGKV